MGEDNCVYKNKIKISQKVDDCDFSYSFENNKYTVTVNFKTDSINLTGDKAITYSLL